MLTHFKCIIKSLLEMLDIRVAFFTRVELKLIIWEHCLSAAVALLTLGINYLITFLWEKFE